MASASAGELAGQRVVVVDNLGNHDVAVALDRIAAASARICYLTPFLYPAPNVGTIHLDGLLRRLHMAGAELHPSTEFVELRAGMVVARHLHSGAQINHRADLVVAGIASRPLLTLAPILDDLRIPYQVAGDAVAARTALHAFREGANAVLRLETQILGDPNRRRRR